MTLERTPCFGSCPDYTVTVFGDGRVEYEGRSSVAVEGRQESQIDRETVERLLTGFYDAEFFDMKAEYIHPRTVKIQVDGTVKEQSAFVTDLPLYTVTLRIGDWEKSIVDYYGAPDALRELERMIDAFAGTAQWVEP